MSNTKELKAKIRSRLENIKTIYSIKDIFYQLADDRKLYPHIVFSFDIFRALPDDRVKRNIDVIIDVYTRGTSTTQVDDMADAIEDLFDGKNLPQDDNLPTFYLTDRRPLPDEDKAIKHVQLNFELQNYERK